MSAAGAGDGSLEGQHASMVLLDVESFGDPARTAAHQLLVRAGMYHAVQTAFGAARIPWSRCEVGDRGDGMMILVPADVSKNVIADRLPGPLAEALTAHNAAHAPAARIRMRLALHAGEVHRDPRGPTSDSLTFAFRLLDAAPAKAALAGSPGVLVVIASEWFYDNVIRHDPAAGAEAYRAIEFKTKEGMATAWIRLPGEAGNGALARIPAQQAVESRIPADQLTRALHSTRQASLGIFVDALLAIPTVRQESTRRLLLDHLRPEIANATPYFSQARHHVVSLVRTCMDHPGGLDELLTAVHELEGDSISVRRLDETVARLLAMA